MKWVLTLVLLLVTSIALAQFLQGPMIPVNPGGGTGPPPSGGGGALACNTALQLISACTPQGIMK